MSNGKVILYASEQTGENLPGYVRFALKHLAETDFTVVLLTNKRPLSAETMSFLEDNEITLYLTDGDGNDFAMYRRFLKDIANGRSNLAEFNTITRLLLLNDSIVYFQNNFDKFIRHAESNSADAISLTQSDEIRPHLQPFFLYLKQEAQGAFYLHLLETPEPRPGKKHLSMMEARLARELGLARAFDEAEVQTATLYRTQQGDFSAFRELIAQGGGFIHRALLQKEFNAHDKAKLLRHGAYEALSADYSKLIMDAGLAPDFKEEWLPRPHRSAVIRKIELSVLNAALKVLPHKAD